MEKFIEILLIQFTISKIWRDDLLIFRKLLYISKRALGIFESRLIKIKKERNLGFQFIVDAYTKYVQIYYTTGICATAAVVIIVS